MKKVQLILALLSLVTAGCMKAQAPVQPVFVELPQHSIDYLHEVKPILDKRCVVCHSCYNSPCQLKLSSYEGLERGATKEAVYNATRLKTMDPTRLFTDAVTVEGWRQKGFFSIAKSTSVGSLNDSVMLQLLSHKMKNPVSSGEYNSEADDLTCAADNQELSTYLDKHPNRGMPFGFPPLKEQEFKLIAGWLAQGAPGPTPKQQTRLEAVAVQDIPHVRKWEEFFNTGDVKHIMTARYLYEHLFLAHIDFGTNSGEFYELVRSRTPPGQPVDIIATVRPYDNPGGSLYYRLRKIHSTIVYKTHMVFTLDDAALARYEELFIEPQWLEEPHKMPYVEEQSADPFTTFQQIPPGSRYQFLLDNARYIIMTFIRGPVCKGQVALNVINDHFWLLFLDPQYDLTVRYPAFLKLHRDKLRMPASTGSDISLFKAAANRFHRLAMEYQKVRQDFYMAHYFNGMGYDGIWKGERAGDTPLLTVFRHFDSASVHKGALGDLPRTLWVIDYPLMERIYYSLVAGFDVYGNVVHQLTTRLYMDGLRREGEGNFLNFLPRDARGEMLAKWYIGRDLFHEQYHETEMPSSINYVTDNPKKEFIENLVENYLPAAMAVGFDEINYSAGKQNLDIPATLTSLADYLQGLHAVSASADSFFQKVTNHNANVAYIRVKKPDGMDSVVSAVLHRWHDNVTFLFREKNTFDAKRDSADFFPGFIGSYPNYFFVVEEKEMGEFLSLLQDYEGDENDLKMLGNYGVNRNDDDFWEVYDWFQQRFLESDPLNSGLFDLNRYYYKTL